MTNETSAPPLPLRSRAETVLQARADAPGVLLPEEYQQLLHELQVHRIELELQNEELRHSQAALEDNRARYMNLYHNAPVGYVVLNRSGIIKETNATFARMVSTDSPHLHGKPFADFLAADDQAIFRSRLRSFFKNPTNKHIEVRLKSTASTGMHVDLAAASQQCLDSSEDQSHDELFVTVTDITARAEAERSLQKSQNFVTAVLDSLASHVCVLDEHGTILAVNEAWRRLAVENPPIVGGLAEGANYLAICDNTGGEEQETARLFATGIRSVLHDEKETFSLEYPCHSSGKQRWFLGRVTKLIGDTPRAAIVVAHENITDRKHLEQEQLFYQDKLKQLAKAESLSLMAGAISHNFNNMLGVVLGNLELALDMLEKRGDSNHNIKDALQAAWRASEMSGLMLTYLGQTIAPKEPVDISSACNQIVHLLQLAKPREIVLATDFPLPGPLVRANAQQMQQIFSNLVANAWEAMEDKPGAIHVSLQTVCPEKISSKHRFPLDWQPQDKQYACLSVRDNGCGIQAENMEKLFDPFFTSKFTGRGMGLAVVLGILRSHEGAVTVESRPGAGSVFRIYIPVLD